MLISIQISNNNNSSNNAITTSLQITNITRVSIQPISQYPAYLGNYALYVNQTHIMLYTTLHMARVCFTSYQS